MSPFPASTYSFGLPQKQLVKWELWIECQQPNLDRRSHTFLY